MFQTTGIKKRADAGLILLGIIVVAVSVISIGHQHDFRVYYWAGRAFADNLDPYNVDNLSLVADTPIKLGYYYPPITLSFLSLFGFMSFNAASFVFLVLKLAAFGWLIYIWKRWFTGGKLDLLFLLLCLFAFRSAVLLDIRAGNISIFEQVILWLGFLMWWRNKLESFVLCIVAVAMFKLTPILFLGLLLFSKHPMKYVYFTGGIVLFLGLNYLSYLWYPGLFNSFLSSAVGVDESGVTNPSSLAMIRDACDTFIARSGIHLPGLTPQILYMVFVATIVGVTCWRLKAFNGQTGGPEVIFLSCLAYALIAPRFKDYSYILLILPAWHIISHQKIVTPPVILGVFVILFSQSYPLVWNYSSLLLAFLLWLIGIGMYRKEQAGERIVA